jgi:hypothetical protein
LKERNRSMRTDESYTYEDNNGQPRSSGKFELFFFESAGSRTHLRFTRLGVVLILCFTVIPVLAIFTLFLYNRIPSSSEQINVNVRSSPSPDATPIRNVIIQAPRPQPLPKVHRAPLLPPPNLPAGPVDNMNEKLTPRQRLQGQPAKPPT